MARRGVAPGPAAGVLPAFSALATLASSRAEPPAGLDGNDDSAGAHGCSPARLPPRTPAVVVVLGCAVRLDARGRLSAGALARRIETAVRAYAAGGDAATLVIASGGRRWGTSVEADVMAQELRLRGVPAHAVVRERLSLSTRDNARFVAAFLARRGIGSAAVVTCPFHLRRAAILFARAGVQVDPIPAAGDREETDPPRLWTRLREAFLTWVDVEIPARRTERRR